LSGKGGVFRAVILKYPSENLREEVFGFFQVIGGKFDVVYGFVYVNESVAG